MTNISAKQKKPKKKASLFQKKNVLLLRVVELVDTPVWKTVTSNGMRVRIPSQLLLGDFGLPFLFPPHPPQTPTNPPNAINYFIPYTPQPNQAVR